MTGPSITVAVGVDPVGAGDGCLVALRRDRRPRTHAPDMLAKAMARIAPVADNPLRHTRQPIQERHGVGQFVCLAGCNPEGDGVTRTVGDHASLGSIPATRAAKRFTMVSLG